VPEGYGDVMNENHTRLCPSPEWAEHLHSEVLPAVTAGVALGEELLELGPGPGAATDWLRTRVRRVVAVEHDKPAADALARRLADTNVEVLHGDATALVFADASFDSAAAFTMLHHVPTRVLQTRLLAEALRVLRPGGALIGYDSMHSDELHHFHEGDTYNPIDPPALLTILLALGYCDVTVTVDWGLKFVAHAPRA
jgi:ubiquinone/menaquinone biosynthesis C-methylase UbiE